MSVTGLSNQINTNTMSALSGNTTPLASTIKQDAQNVENDIASGNAFALQQDTSKLVNDTNQAVSSGAITSQQAGAIQLPAAEAMEGTLVAEGFTSGAPDALAALFQKYAQANHLPTDAAHFEQSWSQFANDIGSSVPGFNFSQNQATLQQAHNEAAQQAGVSVSSGTGQQTVSGNTVAGSSSSLGGPSSAAVQGATDFVNDVVNGSASTAALFTTAWEADYQSYCAQYNLNPTQYSSYVAFNQAVEKQASGTIGSSSPAMAELEQWQRFSVFSQVRQFVGGSTGTGA